MITEYIEFKLVNGSSNQVIVEDLICFEDLILKFEYAKLKLNI